MRYKVMLFVAFVGLVLYFFGYVQGATGMQIGGIVLTALMFTTFMARKLVRR